MLSPLHGFLERESIGLFTVKTATSAGLAMDIDSTNTAPMIAGTYAAVYGNVVTASCTTSSNNTRELGWLLQPVTSGGPTLLEVLTQVYDESVAANNTAVLVMSKAGALLGTDQYATGSTTGHFSISAQTPGTILGISAGQPRLLQSGDVARLKLIGAVVQRGFTLAAVQIL